MENETSKLEKDTPLNDVQSRREILDSVLDGYINNLGVVEHPNIKEQANRFLNLTPSDLVKLSGEECGEGAYCLTQFVIAIQNALNKEISRLNWATKKIEEEIVPQLKNYNVGSFNQNAVAAMLDNSYAKKLNDIKVYCSGRIERLQELPKFYLKLADRLESLAVTKRKSE